MCLSWKDPSKSSFLIQPKDIRSGSVSNREVSQGRTEARKWHCHCTVVLIWGKKITVAAIKIVDLRQKEWRQETSWENYKVVSFPWK